MAKWIATEKVRVELRHAVVCPNVTGRIKEKIAQSKRASAGSLHTWPIGSPKNPSREIFTLGRGIEWYITLPRNFEKYYPL